MYMTNIILGDKVAYVVAVTEDIFTIFCLVVGLRWKLVMCCYLISEGQRIWSPNPSTGWHISAKVSVQREKVVASSSTWYRSIQKWTVGTPNIIYTSEWVTPTTHHSISWFKCQTYFPWCTTKWENMFLKCHSDIAPVKGHLKICVADSWKTGYIHPIVSMLLADETLLAYLKVLTPNLFSYTYSEWMHTSLNVPYLLCFSRLGKTFPARKWKILEI